MENSRFFQRYSSNCLLIPFATGSQRTSEGGCGSGTGSNGSQIPAHMRDTREWASAKIRGNSGSLVLCSPSPFCYTRAHFPPCCLFINFVYFRLKNQPFYIFWKKTLSFYRITARIAMIHEYHEETDDGAVQEYCRKEWSMFSDSFFEKSRMPFNESLIFSYFWLAGVRRQQLCTITGSSQ
ncbi:hypothetical protein RF11_14777 [Thelohanellus kitauei]|uniref:Uncharacterized protein n=1 Tax=Thelohanellus kitauei TaxID=669202 RepID=A0A0C2N6H8_THEKT|nr:hypothetical protein RF11_14777 [Thelohanellus kitauei]